MLKHDDLVRPAAVQMDPAVAATLESKGLLQRLVALYLQSAPPLVEAAAAAVARGDHDAAGNAFHTLKSSSATLGFTAFSDLCKRLEIAARQGDGATYARAMPQFHDAYRSVVDALERIAGPSVAGDGA